MSPGLAETSELKGLPNAYFILGEMDLNKDEVLIYAERLRREGKKFEKVLDSYIL